MLDIVGFLQVVVGGEVVFALPISWLEASRVCCPVSITPLSSPLFLEPPRLRT